MAMVSSKRFLDDGERRVKLREPKQYRVKRKHGGYRKPTEQRPGDVKPKP